MSFESLQKQIHKNAVNKGFWDGATNIPEKIALVHSELSEALEAHRSLEQKESEKITGFTEFEEELADAVIRICDLAEATEARLYQAMLAKHEYNQDRPYKHGKKY